MPSAGFDTTYMARFLTLGRETHAPAQAMTGPKRALVVEGDGFTRMRLITCLVAAGFSVDVAPNGRLALAKLLISVPDTLVLELNLRGISGLDLIQHARRHPTFGKRPIYVFTAVRSLRRAERKELAESGAEIFDKQSVAEETLVTKLAADLLGKKLNAEQLQQNAAALAVSAASLVSTTESTEGESDANENGSKPLMLAASTNERPGLGANQPEETPKSAEPLKMVGEAVAGQLPEPINPDANSAASEACIPAAVPAEAMAGSAGMPADPVSELPRNLPPGELEPAADRVVSLVVPAANSGGLQFAEATPVSTTEPASADSNPASSELVSEPIGDDAGQSPGDVQTHAADPSASLTLTEITTGEISSARAETSAATPVLQEAGGTVSELMGTSDPADPCAAAHVEEPAHALIPAEPLPEETKTLIREEARRLASCAEPAERIEACAKLRAQVDAFLREAPASAVPSAAAHGEALVGLFDQLCQAAEHSSASAADTIEKGLEVLSGLSRGHLEGGRELRTCKVVIVDESAESRQALQQAFEKAGFAPALFSEPAEVAAHLAGHPADLIISNLVPARQQELGAAVFERDTPILFTPPRIVPESADASISTDYSNHQPAMPMELLVKAINVLHERMKPDAAAEIPPVAPDIAPEGVIGATMPESRLGDRIPDSIQARLATPADREAAAAPEKTQCVTRDEEPAIQSAGNASGQKNHKRIAFFVEDDPVVLRVYKRALVKEGFRVECAADGRLAVENLPKAKPHVVILDLMLPKLHGLEVLKFIRGDADLKDVPVVVLSNAFMEGLAAKALAEGANRALVKSQCTPAELVRVVSELLANTPDLASGDNGLIDSETGDVPCGDAEETCLWVRQNHTQRDAPGEIAKIRQACRAYARTFGSKGVESCLDTFCRRVRYFCTRAGLSGFTKLECVASALEALLFEIMYRNIEPTPPVLRTITQAVDCLGLLAEKGDVAFSDAVRRRRVLVVDGDAKAMFTTVAALKLARVDAVGTQSGSECLRMVDGPGFDLIILAVDLPDKSGFDVCEQLRRMPKYASCPVIFLTSSERIDNRARGVLVGASDYVLKPIVPADLTLKVTLQLVNYSSKTGSAGIPAAASDVSNGSASPRIVESNAQSPSAAAGESFEELRPQVAASEGEVKAAVDVPAAHLSEQPQLARAAGGLSAESAAPSPLEAEPQLSLEKAATAPATIDQGVSVGAQEPVKTERGEGFLKEREVLIARIYSSESDLHMERERVKRRNHRMKALQQEVNTLKAQLAGAGAQGGKSPDEKELAGLHQRNQELQQRLQELEQQVTQGKQGEDELRRQLASGAEAQQRSQSRCGELEQEMAALRQSRDEVGRQLEQQKAQSADQEQCAKELETRLSKVQEQLAVRERGETELRREFQCAEQGHRQTQTRCAQLEQDLAGAERKAKELAARLSGQEGECMEVELRAREMEKRLGELEIEAKQRAKAEMQLRRQFDDADRAQHQLQTRHGQMQHELAVAQQTRQDLRDQVARQQGEAIELEVRNQELEKRLAELEQQIEQRGDAVTDVLGKLETASAAERESAARCSQLEQELDALRQSRQELSETVGEEKSQTTQLEQHAQELERRLAELQQQVAERAQVEAQLREQVDDSTKFEREAQARYQQLEQDLAASRQNQEELTGHVENQKKLVAKLTQRGQGLETRLAKLRQQSRERAGIETSLRQELDSAANAQREAQARCTQLEQASAALEQARSELAGKLEQEKDMAAKLQRRNQELNKRLADVEEQSEHRGQTETELRCRLDSGNESQRRLQSRCEELERELGLLRQTRDELSEKVGQEQNQVLQFRQRAEHMEQRLAEFERDASEHTGREAELRSQLDSGAETLRQAQARCSRLEQELASVAQSREELAGKVAEEKNLAAKLDERGQELEKDLAEIQQQVHARAQVEEELRGQLEAGAHTQKQLQANCTRLEQELANVTSSREELNAKLAEEKTQSAHLEQRTRALEKSLAEMQEQAQQRAELQAGFRRQLETSVEAEKETQARCGRLEQELAASNQSRAALVGQLEKEKSLASKLEQRSQEMEARVAGLQQQASQHAQLETELRGQLSSETEAQRQAQARCNQLEQELAGLMQGRRELDENLAQQKQLSAGLEQRSQELEKSLAELQQHAARGSQRESELRIQLDAERELRRQAQARCSQLEQDVVESEQLRQGLSEQAAWEQAQKAQTEKRLEEMADQITALEAAHAHEITSLEQRIQNGMAELARVTADLEVEHASRRTLEQHRASLTTRMQEMHQQLSTHAQSEQAALARQADLDEELQRNRQATERVAAELKQERAQRESAEEQCAQFSKLNAQFQRNVTSLSQANQKLLSSRKDLQSMLDATLAGLEKTEFRLQEERAGRHQVQQQLDAAQATLKEQSRLLERQKADLERALSALAELEARFGVLATEREHLSQELHAARTGAELRDAQSRLELSKAEATLAREALERKRIESNLLGLRQVAINSVRTSRVVRNDLCRCIREPANALLASSRQLLALEMTGDQRLLVESVLEQALLLNTRLEPQPVEPALVSLDGTAAT